MNIALFLEMAAEAAPDRVGIVCDGRRWSYAELLAGARGAATLIRESGCAHVALLDESSEAAAMVRAEAVQLSATASASANCLPITQSTAVYKGKYVDLIADSPVGEIISRSWDREAPSAPPAFAIWPPEQTTIAA